MQSLNSEELSGNQKKDHQDVSDRVKINLTKDPRESHMIFCHV